MIDTTNATLSEADQLADRVRSGQATIVHLADKIASDRRVDKDTAFVLAERMLRAGTLSLVTPGTLTETDVLAERVRAGQATVVQLANKLEAEHRVDRDTAFVMAERMLRAR